MILADTSVWAEHIRRGHDGLRFALSRASVVVHEFVLGELVLGHIKGGSTLEQMLFRLTRVESVASDELLAFVRNQRLQGTGIGWTDAHLLAAAVGSGARLWTLDKPLALQARRLGVAV